MMAAMVVVGLFVVLSLLHVLWMFPKQDRGMSWVISEIDGQPAFRPGPWATGAVALLLLVAAWTCATQGGLFGLEPSSLSRFGVWILTVLFILRAVGEFRLVGFFKRVRGTSFARWDTWLFSPLCVLIASLCATVLKTTPQLP